MDKFFAHFERVATVLKWPRDVWTMTLQCVFVGKAQEAYSSLSLEDAADYEKVKQAVLRIYSLVPEAYRQKYRNFQKLDSLTYVEFIREKELLFDRWLNSQDITSFEGLRDLIILEDFKNCLPKNVATYVSEHKQIRPSSAAVLADEYVLSRKVVNTHPVRFQGNVSPQGGCRPLTEAATEFFHTGDKQVTRPRDSPVCGYCKKRGHVLSECYSLKRKNKLSTSNTVFPRSGPNMCVSTPSTSRKDGSTSQAFAPFIMSGLVSLPGEPSARVPIQILRDTGASQSFILDNVLPFSDKSYTGSSVIVQGFEMGFVNVPLHEMCLFSDLVTGNVTVGIRPSLPIQGISMLLGNDLAGGKVLPSPVVSTSPVLHCSDDLAVKFPEVFHSSVVTRAMAQREKDTSDKERDNEQIDLSDTFIAHPVPRRSRGERPVRSVPLPTDLCVKLSHSREQLIVEQMNDPSLSSLLAEAVSEKDIEFMPHGYYFREGVLMRKWRPLTASAADEWRVLNQIVVPMPYRNEILSLAHDHHFSGLLYQLIPPAPLQPIPVTSEPFKHVILDCVGPLPRTKTGKEYLLTIMCTLTRFPEAIPLRRITASAIIKVLVVFFSLFGLPKIVQTDQGSNFMSRMFNQSMQQLGIKHVTSSPYHPQSQGALERFHQTLKSMLRAYCLEFERDWDEGIPYCLFAAQEVVQESLRFSPSELVFGHNVRGPLKILKDSWLTENTSHHSLPEYVAKMRCRLRRACELAKANLGLCQKRMKQRYDRKAVQREFKPGDHVMVLLPILGSALQARYTGPYRVERRVSDTIYVIATPDRRKKSSLCHINMFKRYCERDDTRTVQTSTDIRSSSDEVIKSAVALSTTGGAEIVDQLDAFVSAPLLNGPTVLSSEEGDLRVLLQKWWRVG